MCVCVCGRHTVGCFRPLADCTLPVRNHVFSPLTGQGMLETKQFIQNVIRPCVKAKVFIAPLNGHTLR